MLLSLAQATLVLLNRVDGHSLANGHILPTQPHCNAASCKPGAHSPACSTLFTTGTGTGQLVQPPGLLHSTMGTAVCAEQTSLEATRSTWEELVFWARIGPCFARDHNLLFHT